MTDRERHRNDERTVKCPVEGCDAEVLARGINLHVRRSSGNGHGPRGEVPDDVSFDDLETVGSEAVEMDYPEERDTEQVARLCPYCGTPFTGKQGVLIHLGQVAGRKNHPEDAADKHEPENFPRVTVDEQGNVVEMLGEPTTEDTIPISRVYQFIAELQAEGHTEMARKARNHLLNEGETESPSVSQSLSRIYEAIIREGQSGNGRGVTLIAEDDALEVRCRGEFALLSLAQSRLLAEKVEQNAERNDWLNDGARRLIESLREGGTSIEGTTEIDVA